MTVTATEIQHLRAALALAEGAVSLSEPNPRVGCVITTPDGGEVIGQGHTQAAGEAHAEVMALHNAASRGALLQGATVLVTLEPCSHHGRTPPCCDALVAAGVGRVVVGQLDPNPQVHGQGVAALRGAGIDVTLGPEDLARAARELNIGFFSRMERGRPWVRLKVAVSLDGRTALPDGRSQWITGEAARCDAHRWRRRAGAVLSGVGTVLKDDPRLDVRLVDTPRQPLRVIVDTRLDTPATARLFSVADSPLLFYAASPVAHRRMALQAQQAEVVELPGPQGRVDLSAMLADLARRGVNELHVEAGERLNGALLSAGLVDELLVYVAPMLIGPGKALAALPELDDLALAARFRLHAVEALADDLRLLLRPGAG